MATPLWLGRAMCESLLLSVAPSDRLVVPEDPPSLCDFGSGLSLQTCSWTIPPNVTSRLQWKTGQGGTAFWLGGPRADHTLSDETGGYVFFETSFASTDGSQPASGGQPADPSRPSTFGGRQFTQSGPAVDQADKDAPTETALLVSRNITRTGPSGLCLSFYYTVQGLSADRLRVLLRDVDDGDNRTLWQSSNGGDGGWHKGEVAYTFGGLHQVIFEGIPKKATDPARIFRGYIGLDDVVFQRIDSLDLEHCQGHCTFEGGFCGWTNEEDDDFDWELGRGSQSFLTGPSRDYSSFGKEEQTGGYAFIEASFPRRPGDTAKLISPAFPATGDNNPVCLRFATHMFGNGIGVLRVLQREAGGVTGPRPIWEIRGEAGNSWYTAQVPVSSATDYQLIFDGVVGTNSLGNIAIDNVSFSPGTCPISPQTAARNSGDCNFEEDSCGWTNALPQDGVDDFDWARQYSYNVNGPPVDHTKGTGEGYYMNLLSNPQLPQRGGTRAWLVSPLFPGVENSRCIAFYYYMYERTIDPAGPSLGSLRLYVRSVSPDGPGALTPVWRLNNHQGQRWLMARAPIVLGADRAIPEQPYQVIIEGIWGDGRVGYIAIDDISFFDGDCSTQPNKGTAVMGECSFERDMCGWRNSSEGVTHEATVGRGSSGNIGRQVQVANEALTWRLATVVSRPANLQDHTFRAPTGYIFFDIFNQISAQNPVLRSPDFLSNPNDARCISFWFAPFGRGDSTTLSVVRVETTDEEEEIRNVLWRLSTHRFDTTRPDWIYGQVTLSTVTDYRLEFEGEATDGGFALDDVTFYDGNCQVRPQRAAVAPGQ